MAFNSIVFLSFFLVAYAIYRALPHKAQNIFLLIASYVFYGWWDTRFIFLIIIATCLDFTCSLIIHNGYITQRQRLTVSSWTVIGAFSFLVVQWYKLGHGLHRSQSALGQLFSWRMGWILFFIIAFLTLIMNLFYAKISLIEMQKKRKIFLIVSISGNLAILGFFKYFNFFIGNIAVVIRSLGLNPVNLHLNILLPIGISFYTFMTMSYTIDVYRGRLIPTNKLYEYALYLAFFPKILAGPIERAVNFLPQIIEKRKISSDQIMSGLHQILYGFFKKVVIADGVAKTVSNVFGATYQVSWIDAIVGILLFTFQIYCDFSGYSDIAIGTAHLFGFDLMRNFHFPYFARNPSEFWGRWHISLSSWFRDYVFFPLGGPYGSAYRWIRNILLTFFVTGLWHGAAWNYILWGLYHGIMLCVHRVKESLGIKKKRSKNPLKKIISILFFFILTSLGWVLFRSHSLGQIKAIFKVLLFDFGDLKLNVTMPTHAALLGLPLFVIIEFIGYNSHGKRLDKVLPMGVRTAVYAAMIFLIILGMANVPSTFIYFVF